MGKKISKFHFLLFFLGVFAISITRGNLSAEMKEKQEVNANSVITSSNTNTGSSDVIFKTFNYPDGKIKERVYYEDGKEIAKEIFDTQDKVIIVIKKIGSIPDGVIKYYDENSKLKTELNYKNGKLEGISKTYFESGKLQSEYNYKDGKLEGLCKQYYEKGELKAELNYKNSKLEGISKTYHENGKLQAEYSYKNGKSEGPGKEYYENGKLKAELNYKNGKLEGISKVYHESGELKGELNYKNGKSVKLKTDNR